MRISLENVEKLVLSTFPLLYCLVLLPAKDPFETFLGYKITTMAIFVILLFFIKLFSSKDIRLSDSGSILASLPSFYKALILFFIATLTSTFLSDNNSQATFGVAGFRTGCLFIMLCGVTFWIYSFSPSISRKGLVLLAITLSLITVLEYLGFRPLSFITEKYEKLQTAYPAATVGYRGQLAGLSLIICLLPLYWFRDSYTDWRFWFLWVSGCVALGCATNSSALVSLTCVVSLFTVLYGKFKPEYILIPVVALASLNVYRPLFNLNNYLYSINWVKHKSESKDVKSTLTFRTRLILWESGSRMFLKKPILGWGPQLYNQHWYEYLSKEKGDQLFRLELGLQSGQKMVRIGDSAAYKTLSGEKLPVALKYASPHNAVIDLLYSQGIVGFSLFVLFLILLVRYMSKRMGRVAWLALLPLIGYFIYLGAWFITVPATGLAAIILGMVVSDARNAQPDKIGGKEVH